MAGISVQCVCAHQHSERDLILEWGYSTTTTVSVIGWVSFCPAAVSVSGSVFVVTVVELKPCRLLSLCLSHASHGPKSIWLIHFSGHELQHLKGYILNSCELFRAK